MIKFRNVFINLIALCCYFQGLPGEMGADGPVGPPGPQVSIVWFNIKENSAMNRQLNGDILSPPEVYYYVLFLFYYVLLMF